MSAPTDVSASDLSLLQLESRLLQAYHDIVSAHGASVAVQAVGRLLAAPSPLSIKVDRGSDNGSELGSLPASEPSSPAAGQLDETLRLTMHSYSKAPSKWRRAVMTAVGQNVDPWAGRNLHLLPMEHCVRLRYNSKSAEWVSDDVLVKMEAQPFAAGAMRECYAMKKLSTFSSNVFHDWKKAQNCVAKRYKKDSKKRLYFTDVLVQMDAKSLGDEYNKTDPPKKVDVLQCAVLQFCDRPSSPLYCVEQLIEGDYVKYNSNSGFVKGDENLIRFTPQAFSHYTFELTHGYKMCVDIQGVGDLYTDPQIHTLDGEAYGDGNLGLRGMALFFRTHECNDLCTRLSLKPFQRCDSDIKAQGYASESSMDSSVGSTVCRSLRRRSSYVQRYKGRKDTRKEVANPKAKKDLLDLLKDVPMDEPPQALVHMEVAKLYSEVVLLPDVRPQESPEDALRGGIFHLQFAASQGCLQALCMLARVHLGLEPTLTQFAHLIKVGKQTGEMAIYPELAWQYAKLAAERGVVSACAAVAHSYATGQGLGEHVLEEAQPDKAVEMYERVLKLMDSEGKQDNDIASSAGDSLSDSDAQGSTLALAHSLSWASRGTRSEAERKQQMELPVSKDFVGAMRHAAEEEAAGLPGASAVRYEVLAHLGTLLMEAGQQYAAAADYFSQAAEAAEAALKPKLSMKYYELAEQAQGLVEEGEEESGLAGGLP